MKKIFAGVSAACGYPEVPEVFIKKLCEAGVKRLEYFANCDYEIRRDYVKELKNICDQNGSQIVSMHPFTCAIDTYALFSDYERRTQEFIDYHKRYFEAMNILGAKYFVFHGSKRRFDDALIFERFKRLADAGKEFGVTVLQENVDQKVTGELETLKKMKNSLGDDANFVLDTKQAVRMGWNVFDGVSELKNSIRHVHISDHGEKGDCLLLGEGRLDLDAFVKALSDVGFEGTIMLELYRRAFSDVNDLIKSMKLIEQAIDRV